MSSKPTIRDIAAVCGVTIATVSRVINNKPGVRKEIRRHVQRYIEQIGWNCSSLKTRLLKASSAKTVFILCGLNILNGGGRYSMGETLQLLIDRLEGEGILPFVVFGRTLQMLEECRRLKPHAVILFTKNPWMEDPVRRLVKAGVRVCAAYGNEFAGNCPQVRSGHEAAVRKALRDFHAAGCRNIGLFAGNGMFSRPEKPEEIIQYWVRNIALELEKHSPEFSLRGNVVSDEFGTVNDLRKALRNNEFDAWLCCEHSMLQRFCEEAEKAGIRIPEDLPVTAFCSEENGFDAPLKVNHFVSQTGLIAEQLFRWIMAESFPDPEEIVVPYLYQKGNKPADSMKRFPKGRQIPSACGRKAKKA